nr:hypothetical protein Itr_chr11CG03750 [Ipomoea trifida]
MEMSTTHAEYNNTCNKNYDSFATSVPAFVSGRLEQLTSLSTVRSQQALLSDLAALDSETLEPVAILSKGIFVMLSHTTLLDVAVSGSGSGSGSGGLEWPIGLSTGVFGKSSHAWLSDVPSLDLGRPGLKRATSFSTGVFVTSRRTPISETIRLTQ